MLSFLVPIHQQPVRAISRHSVGRDLNCCYHNGEGSPPFCDDFVSATAMFVSGVISTNVDGPQLDSKGRTVDSGAKSQCQSRG